MSLIDVAKADAAATVLNANDFAQTVSYVDTSTGLTHSILAALVPSSPEEFDAVDGFTVRERAEVFVSDGSGDSNALLLSGASYDRADKLIINGDTWDIEDGSIRRMNPGGLVRFLVVRFVKRREGFPATRLPRLR